MQALISYQDYHVARSRRPRANPELLQATIAPAPKTPTASPARRLGLPRPEGDAPPVVWRCAPFRPTVTTPAALQAKPGQARPSQA